MAKPPAPRYSGPLDAAGIAKGMAAAVRNSRRLAEDAEALLGLGRYPSAAALAILSIEESGKTTILRRLAIEPDAAGLRAAWKEYRQHTAKNSHWVLPQLVGAGARKLRDFHDAAVSGPHSDLLDAVKQVATYSDCLGDAHWSEPHAVIDKGLAASLLAIAKLVLPGREATTREIELWVEHVGPHMAKPSMGHAVIVWTAAMRAEGLSEVTPESMAAFMDGSGVPEEAS